MSIFCVNHWCQSFVSIIYVNDLPGPRSATALHEAERSEWTFAETTGVWSTGARHAQLQDREFTRGLCHFKLNSYSKQQ